MQPLCPRGTLWRKQTRFPPLGNRFTRLRTRDFQFTLLLRGCKNAPPFPPPPLRILLRRAEYVSVHTCQRGRGGPAIRREQPPRWCNKVEKSIRGQTELAKLIESRQQLSNRSNPARCKAQIRTIPFECNRRWLARDIHGC